MRRIADYGVPALTAIGVAVLLILAVVAGASYYQEDTHTGCVVSDKDRTTKTDSEGNSSSDARVYTENCGVFQVSDSFWKGEFNSSDTYGSIKVGETYDFTTIGWRNGFFSMFPNIIEVHESD